MRTAAGGIPAIALIGAALVMVTYPLTEQVFRRIVAENAERRAGNDGGDGPESQDPDRAQDPSPTQEA
ncbi:hypothetical protein [Knoellia sinensis]|uniref:hypothetical protein n=1 Tax=Knoellia sinensis TaxID=136100 RepID=UPI00068C9172|nr:hypothetical protein [Knoellia sinensis]